MKKLVFNSKKDAVEFLRNIEWLNELSCGNVFFPKGIYYLHHGEFTTPEFKPVRYKDGWGIKKIHYYYYGTLNAPKDGRCVAIYEGNEKIQLILQDSLGI